MSDNDSYFVTSYYIEEIKYLLSDINPETGFVYNIREIAKKTGVGRNTISSINLKMRRHKN